MKYLLSIIPCLCLWAGCAWAFPPEFVGSVTQGVAGSAVDCTGYRFKWEAASTTAECFDTDDGGTITLTNVTLSGGVAIIDNVADKISFPATEGNNVATASSEITIRYRMVGGTAPSFAHFWSHSNSASWKSQRDSTSTTAVRYNINVYVILNPAINIYDGNWHTLVWTHNSATPLRKFCVDGTCVESATVFTTPSLASGSFFIGSESPTATTGLIGEIDYVWIK